MWYEKGQMERAAERHGGSCVLERSGKDESQGVDVSFADSGCVGASQTWVASAKGAPMGPAYKWSAEVGW